MASRIQTPRLVARGGKAAAAVLSLPLLISLAGCGGGAAVTVKRRQLNLPLCQ